MPRNFLFLDTMIPNEVSGGIISPGTYDSVFQRLTAQYSYRISPATLIELFVRMARGDDLHFAVHQRAIRTLVRTCREEYFLRFPGDFLFRELFNQRCQETALSPREFRLWARVALRARNRQELTDSGVDWLSTNQRFGLSLQMFEDQGMQGRHRHRERLLQVQQGHITQFPEPRLWAREFLQSLGKEDISEEECGITAERLAVAYEFDRDLFNVARNENYRIEEHTSDWMDYSNLFYLTHPDFVFVTKERRLLRAAVASGESHRVFDFPMLLHRLGIQDSEVTTDL